MVATETGARIESPPRDTRIWRYIDFVRFVAMLNFGGLFFSRADLLGDPFEGTFSPQSVEEFCLATGRPYKQGRAWADVLRDLRKYSYVSCWYESEGESAALWSLYGNSIALRTTVGRLVDFLGKKYDVGRVRYIDYTAEHPDIRNSAGALLYKRCAYGHEREIRAITQTFTYEGGALVAGGDPGIPGKYALGNLHSLVEAVVAAPQTPEWQRELISQVARKGGLNKLCESSALDVQPPSCDA